MKNGITALIVDDSAPARRLLRLMLAALAPDIEVLGEAANVQGAVEVIKSNRPDVVFLDIEMPGESGLQLAAQLSRDEVPYEIVFTTAYNQYAIRAFRLSAVDYLLKPIDEKQLLEAVEKVRSIKSNRQTAERLKAVLQNMQHDTSQTLTVPVLNGHLFLNINEILYLKADGAYTHIYLQAKQPVTVSKNLKYFEAALNGLPGFVRVHRSYLINTRHIVKYDKADRGSVIMSDDAVIDIARERREVLFDALGI